MARLALLALLLLTAPRGAHAQSRAGPAGPQGAVTDALGYGGESAPAPPGDRVRAEQQGEQTAEQTSPADPDRPSEDELFGGAASQDASTIEPSKPSEPPAAAAVRSLRDDEARQDEEGLTAGIRDRFGEDGFQENPLVIGGLFYQRFSGTHREGPGLTATSFTAPTLVDGYFDARPNDRLRAMVVARLLYDPLLSQTAFVSDALGLQPLDNPSLTLDQLWLRFDILRTVFVTIGRQHVKWGTGRFWNPTDYLHPVRRDALALFDARVGTNLIKLHLPIESNGANVYALALLDDFGSDRPFGDVGAAFRAEWVWGRTELGVDGLVQLGRTPRYGFDVSSALGPFDVYGELAWRTGHPARWVENRASAGPAPASPDWIRQRQEGIDWSATAGADWTFAYTERDTATVGGEYFYNAPGYDDPRLYPWLLFNGELQPFYTGRHYAALFAMVQGPGSWDDTRFVLSNLANLSDRSFVTRLDYTVRVLTHLTVEANASVFYGSSKGEFRLELDLPETATTPPMRLPPQRFMLGLGLRLDL